MKLNKIFIFSDNLADYEELAAGARILANESLALVIGTRAAADGVGRYGLKTYWMKQPAEDIPVENYIPSIATLIDQEQPDLVLMKSCRRGKLIAGRLGVILRAGVVADAVDFEINDDHHLSIGHLVYGGTAIRLEKPATKIKIALTGNGVFPVAGHQPEIQEEVIAIDDLQIESNIVRLDTHRKKQEETNLSMAKRVVSVGRGLAKKEDLGLVRKLATALGAEMACSRPIAEGEKWMPKERYIGVSGAMIKPDIYFALGISGQIQHMVGVNRSRVIVAVNKDKNAPIFHDADYGIVGDLYKVLPELIKLVQQ